MEQRSSPAAPHATEQLLPAHPEREGPRKGGLKKVLFRLTRAACRSCRVIPPRGRKYKNKKTHMKLTIATWNVRTLLDLPEEHNPGQISRGYHSVQGQTTDPGQIG